MKKSETIVAPMTPNGISAVAGIRVSGEKAKEVCLQIFGKILQPRFASYVVAKSIKEYREIDSVLAIFFENPASYTGEDVLEIFTHGNPLIVRDLLHNILEVDGVRLAEPGEFTKRAFLNGKLDLVQAASVGELIHSATRSALKNARKLLSGKFSNEVRKLSKSILEFSALVELDVDFAEEEADPDYSGWASRIENILERIDALLTRFKNAASLNHVPLVVLYGEPNAGKSSLVNALLEEDRLLVSSIPGTTRDFVEVRLLLEGGEVALVDTAGVGDAPGSELEALSMEKSRQILERADLKIHVIDVSKPRQNSILKSEEELLVLSKSDLLHENFEIPENALLVSAKKRLGLSEFKKILNQKCFAAVGSDEDFYITSEREKTRLEDARKSALKILEYLKENGGVELIAFELQVMRRSLQSITGEISSEDILQSIFAGFCIGK